MSRVGKKPVAVPSGVTVMPFMPTGMTRSCPVVGLNSRNEARPVSTVCWLPELRSTLVIEPVLPPRSLT